MDFCAEVYTEHQLVQAINNPLIKLIYAPYSIVKEKHYEHRERIVIIPPVYLADCEDIVIKNLTEFKNTGFCNAVAHTVGHIELLNSLGFKIFGGYRLNCTNGETIDFYRECGVSDIIVSPELSAVQINNLKRNNIGFIAYGFLPMMITRRCPIKNGKPCNKSCCNKTITDRKGNKSGIICNNNTAEILNSDVLYLGDKMNHFKSVDFAVLKFTVEDEIDKIIDNYADFASPQMKKFTRGLYFRGIKE